MPGLNQEVKYHHLLMLHACVVLDIGDSQALPVELFRSNNQSCAQSCSICIPLGCWHLMIG